MPRLPVDDWCSALGLAQSAWARLAGIPPPVLCDLARGRRNPTLRTIGRLAEAIRREPWELLRGPRPGEGLPTEEEALRENLAWLSSLTPRARARAAEGSARFVRRARRLKRGA
ncbi:MAG: helix-turn-helix transcriptional regulator [Planctomycetes bacterium]|nr:helix-turn-helix transcriptional regulator [Planctomycetota bacterium]